MNVELEPLTDRHLEKVRKWRNSDLINSVSLSHASISSEMQISWFEGIKNNLTELHWIIRVNAEDAGYGAIKKIDLQAGSCEFASLYLGEEKYLNTGAGAVAEFRIINFVFSEYPSIDKIYCEVLGFNTKVIQLHKRFGFIVESGSTEKLVFTDRSVVSLSLSRLRWEENKTGLQRILIR